MASSFKRFDHFSKVLNGSPVYIGLDVHKRTYSVALFNSTDGLIETYTCPADVQGLVKQFLNFDFTISGIAYETGPTGFGLARALDKAGFRVVVAAGSRIPRGAAASAKSDRIDAVKLAQYLSAGLLKSVAIPTVEEEGYRALVRRRKRVSEIRAKCKQRIKGLLLVLGVEEPLSLTSWTKRAEGDLMALELECFNKQAIASTVRELKFLTDELAILDIEISKATAKLHDEPFNRLKSVPGVGNIAASTFLSEVFNPKRFKRAEEVTSYLGLAPIVSRSGDGPARAKLRPVGQRRLRGLLIEAAWQWTWRDEEAKELYNHHYTKSGISQKAICAVARKLAIKLWKLAVDQSPVPSGAVM
ncbi:MAG: IS110 family transposase [Alphaproteobacteria bacterium]